MTRRIKVFSRLATLATLCFFSCKQHEAASPEEVIGRLRTELESNDVVVLERAAPFEWTSAYVFPPYTADEELDRVLGFSWDGPNTSLATIDHFFLIVFVHDNTVVQSVEFPIREADFSREVLSRKLLRKQAKFRVEHPDSGRLTNGKREIEVAIPGSQQRPVLQLAE